MNPHIAQYILSGSRFDLNKKSKDIQSYGYLFFMPEITYHVHMFYRKKYISYCNSFDKVYNSGERKAFCGELKVNYGERF